MTSYDDIDFESDNFILPPLLNTDIPASHSALLQPPTTSNLPLPTVQIDEEVVLKPKRKRQIRIKERLLTDRGLNHLRSDAPRQLKFKGKGYEKQDLQKLLSYYQLWLHDVFPKATFRDCIQMVMKEGHHNEFKIKRKEWIDGAKEQRPVEISNEEMEALEEIEKEDQEREMENVNANKGAHEDNSGPVMEKGDEPLFVDDFSDIDMDEILSGSQKEKDPSTEDKPGNGVATVWDNHFEDEMDVLREMGMNIS